MPLASPIIRYEMRATLALAAPLAGANLANMAMGLTNAIMVGHLGGASLAAAGLGAALYFTLVMLGQGVLTAVAPLAAHSIGADDHRGAGRVAGAGIVLAAMLAVPAVAGLTIAPRLLALLGYDETLAADVARYLSAVRWGAPAFLAAVVFRAVLSATGHVRPIMVVVWIGVPANIALNWVLVFGHFGMPSLGIVGSGCATSIVQWLVLLGVGGYALLGAAPARLRFRGRLRGDLGRIIRVGLPISGMVGLEVGLFNAAGVLMGLLGAEALGAHQLAINFASLTFMVPLGIAQAATVRVALLLGAGDPGAARRAGFVALALGTVLMLPGAVLMLALPRTIIGIYIDLADPANSSTAVIAVQLLVVAALFQVFDGAQVIAAGALRGYRDTTVPMLAAALGYWGAGFAGGCVLAFPLGYGAVGIWWGLALGLAMVALLLSLRLQQRSRTGYGAASVAPAPALLG